MYNITKQLCGKYNKRIGETVKVRYGRILTTEIKVAKRWKTHFKELLNRPEITAEPEPERELELTNYILRS